MGESLARWFVAVAVLSASLIGSTGGAAAQVPAEPRAAGGYAIGTTALGTFEISSEAIELDGSGLCFDAVMEVVVTTVDSQVDWALEFTVGAPGTVPYNSGYVFEDGSSFRLVEYQYCPATFRATNIVRGEIRFSSYEEVYPSSAEQDFEFVVDVVRAPTQTTLTKLARDSSGYVVAEGRVTTTSREFGRVGTYGEVHLLVKKGGNKWTKVGEGWAGGGLGTFTVYTVKPVPRGATFKVDYFGTDSTAPSQSRTRRG